MKDLICDRIVPMLCIGVAVLLLGVCAASAKSLELADDTIFYIGHSANVLKIEGKVLVFDYPYGTRAFKDILYPVEVGDLRGQNIYVFASHTHGDHFNTGILAWKQRIENIKYVLSYDIARKPADAIIARPGKTFYVDGMKVRGYPSTDAGVAFSIYLGGKHIYFSGDNGYWNWKKNKSEEDYVLEALSCIDRKKPIDIAFQVCMAKAEGIGEGGIGIFAELFQPRLLIPIHSNGDYSINKKVERQLEVRGFKGRYWPVAGKGQSISFANLPEMKFEKKKVTTLHEAAALGDDDVTRALILAGSDINVRNADGRTALHMAAGLGGAEVAKLLLRAGAEVNAQDKYGWTPLRVAVRAYQMDTVELLLGREAQVNAKCKQGQTALDLAVSIGADEIVGILIEAGAKVNVTGGPSEHTPLHSAAELGDTTLVKTLLSKGAVVDARDRMGVPVLFLAVEGGHREVLEVLIDAGADIKAKEKNGRTALHRAVRSGLKDMVEFLIDKGADVNIKDKYGQTPLKIAELSKQTAMAKLLRKHGAKE